jgi:hypothetical protein
MKRILLRVLQVLLAAVVLTYLVDWAVLRVKMSHGTGYGTVQVDQYLSTPLKGNKDEYDFMGSVQEPCSHSLFPHGAAPCWWLAKHTTQWE